MAVDALLALDSGSTLTATTNGTGVDLGGGISPRDLWARVNLTAIGGTTPTLAHKIQHSDDNTTFTDHTTGNPASITAAGMVNIPIITPKRYIRLVSTIGGTNPTITQNAYIGFGSNFPEG